METLHPACRLLTDRLVLRRPEPADADAIFSRYASDPEVTRYLSFPTHRSVDDARAFVAYSDAEWVRWPAGPVPDRTAWRRPSSRGYGAVVRNAAAGDNRLPAGARRVGAGYATEALAAVVGLAGALGVLRLVAHCHTAHLASAHVLEKCGFEREGVLRAHSVFPNLQPGELLDVLCYARALDARRIPPHA